MTSQNTGRNNHFATRPCEMAPHSKRDRLERLISDSSVQLITSGFISKNLNISKRSAGNLLREYMAVT